MVLKTDVLVIGAGSGGYPAAIRAAQLGKEVIVVDKGFSYGGECLNYGCIPSKALISAANLYHKMTHEVSQMGITIENATIDAKKLQEWKNSVKSKLVNGVKMLLKAHKVKTIKGIASFLNKEQVEITKTDGNKEIIEAKNIIIASGAEYISLKGFEIDGIDILGPKEILDLDHIPEELVCIGGGIISLELGTVFAKFGSKVTIIEVMPSIISDVDEKIIKILVENMRELGANILFETKATKYKKLDSGKLEITIDSKQTNRKKITADKVLVSIGKRASTDLLAIEKAGIKTDEKGFIETDIQQKTNVQNIYAVGDCTGMPFLAHRATKHGIIAAEVLSGEPSASDFRSMPGAIFTDPEIAFTGLNEEEAKKAGYDPIVAEAPFSYSGKALAELEEEGFVRVIIDKNTELLLGMQIIGSHATDLISEVSLALEMGATAEDVSFTIHPHPTLPEMVMEAVEAAQGKAIHVANKNKNR